MRRCYTRHAPPVHLSDADIEFILDHWAAGKTAPWITELMCERGLTVPPSRVGNELRKARDNKDPRAVKRKPNSNAVYV